MGTVPTSPVKKTVLIVDDVADVGALVSKMLVPQGFSVIVSQDAEEARDICSRHPAPLDLLITDVLMPRVNGPALAEHARSVHPDIRVLYVSAYDRGLLMDRMNLGSDVPFLLKPFSPEELLQKVREVMSASS
jgi:two-component system cell cycle sensor histidine kinase/response regulator CckA